MTHTHLYLAATGAHRPIRLVPEPAEQQVLRRPRGERRPDGAQQVAEVE